MNHLENLIAKKITIYAIAKQMKVSRQTATSRLLKQAIKLLKKK